MKVNDNGEVLLDFECGFRADCELNRSKFYSCSGDGKAFSFDWIPNTFIIRIPIK